MEFGVEVKIVLEFGECYFGDVGVLVVLLFNCISLVFGEVIFLLVGNLYVYVCGFGVEVMVNFDNVLCGGFIFKYVDVFELLWVLDFVFMLKVWLWFLIWCEGLGLVFEMFIDEFVVMLLVFDGDYFGYEVDVLFGYDGL